MRLIQSKILLLVFLCLAVKSNAQFSSDIPLNEQVASGTLKNGMKYYIMHNEWPKDRVSFYFAQNVGAILEEDNQNGLAHFLEHMAFNGTEHYKGKGIIDMLEKNGVSFGKDINAYTAKDETVYNISNVPVKKSSVIDSTLLVLHDWSGFLLLADDEIDAERGVIREEWRTRNNAMMRFMEQTDKILYKGSKYADRNVIGDMNIINNFKYQELKDYYKKWYRPDLQAVIVVGDIDVKDIEKRVIKLFSALDMPKNAQKRSYTEIPDNDAMQYLLITDKEAQEVRINKMYRRKTPKIKEAESVKRDFIDFMVSNLLNKRYEKLAQNVKSSAFAYGTGIEEISRLEKSFNLTVIPKAGKEKEAYRELITEVERAERFGFTQNELNLLKTNILSYQENALQNSDKIDNNEIAGKLVGYFLTAEPFETPQKEYDRIKKLCSEITVEDLNSAVKKIQTSGNSLLIVTGPQHKEGYYPSQSDYVAITNQVKAQSLETYKTGDYDKPLINDKLKGSAVVKEDIVKEIAGAKFYELSNGARVVIYPTTLAQDEIIFSAVSRGGMSLIKAEDIPSARISIDLAEASGLGDFKNSELQDKLNGKIAGVMPFLSTYTEGFDGSSNRKDFETMLELLYMYFEHPRFDSESYERLLSQYKHELQNSKNNHRKAFEDTVSQLNSNYSKKVPVFNDSFINSLSFKKSEVVYKDRFKNAADFTFFFAGNLPENAMELIQKYVGSISVSGNKEINGKETIYPAPGLKKSLLVRDLEVPKASVYVKYVKELPYTQKTSMELYIMSQLLSKKYIEIIREGEGGSYGVSVRTDVERLPGNSYSLTISFDCNPDKEEKMRKVIFDQIGLIQKQNFSASDIESIKENILKSRAEEILSNRYWIKKLNGIFMFNDEYKSDSEYTQFLKAIDAEDIKNLAKQFFQNPRAFEVVMKSKK